MNRDSCKDAIRSEEYKLVVYFECDPQEFDALHDKALDAITEALGCNKEHECPHFRLAAARPLRGPRRRAVRCALNDLWAAVRHGEIA